MMMLNLKLKNNELEEKQDKRYFDYIYYLLNFELKNSLELQILKINELKASQRSNKQPTEEFDPMEMALKQQSQKNNKKRGSVKADHPLSTDEEKV